MAIDMNFTKLLIDTAKGVNTDNYSTADSNAAIRLKFSEIMGLSANPTKKEMRRVHRDANIMNKVYEVIEDVLEDLKINGWNADPFFNEWVEMRNIASGDVNDFYVEDNSLLTVSKFAGNHHDLLRQKLGSGDSFSVKTSWYGIKVYTDFELMMTGKIDWARFIQKIYESWDNFVNGMIYTAFMDADKALPAEFKKTGTLTAETVEELATLVGDQAGSEVVILGTRAALNKLYKLIDPDWIPASAKEQRNTTGVVSYINGVRTVMLPQVYEAGTRQPLIDNKKLIFMPVKPEFKPIKFVDEGDAYFHEVTDRETNVDMTVEAEYMSKIGVGVVMNLNYGVFSEIA